MEAAVQVVNSTVLGCFEGQNVEGTSNAVDEGLSDHSVLERILEFCDFKKLMESRLVSKSWNQSACAVLQRRCGKLFLFDYDDWAKFDEEQNLQTPNADLSARIPLFVWLDEMSQGRNLDAFWRYDFARALWKNRIVDLILWYSTTAEDVNRLTPLVLQQLPSLKELSVQVGGGNNVNLLPDDFVVDPFAPGAKFKLEYFMYSRKPLEVSDELSQNERELHPTFLRHCTSLKKISLADSTGDGLIFRDFLNIFKVRKAMFEQEQDPPLPKIQNVEFYFYKRAQNTCDLFERDKLLDALADFINMEEPISLRLSSICVYDLPNIFLKIGRWTPKIQTFFADIPGVAEEGEQACRIDLFFRLMKTSLVFAELTELGLAIQHIRHFWSLDRMIPGPSKHRLENVTCLELLLSGFIDPAALVVAADHLPNVHRLKFRAVRFLDDSDESTLPEAYVDFDLLLSACQHFSRLQELELKVDAANRRDGKDVLEHKVEQLRQVGGGGYFKALSLLKHLKKIKIIIHGQYTGESIVELAYLCHLCQSTTKRSNIYFVGLKRTAMLALFHGYEPQVPLELQISPWNPEIQYRRALKLKLQLDVQQFKDVLYEAEDWLEQDERSYYHRTTKYSPSKI